MKLGRSWMTDQGMICQVYGPDVRGPNVIFLDTFWADELSPNDGEIDILINTYWRERANHPLAGKFRNNFRPVRDGLPLGVA